MCVGEVARGLGCDRRSFPVGPSSSPPDSQGPRNGLFPTERARAADWPRVFALIQHVLRNTCSMWELGYSGAQARHVPWSPLTFSILSPPPRPSQQPELSLAHVAGPARPLLLALWEASEDTESLTPGEEGFRPNPAPQAEVGLGVPGPPAWL